MSHDPLKEICEIRNQFSYSKRIGFLLGAGTSKAIGISDTNELTKKVEEELNKNNQEYFSKILKSLPNTEYNIEDILNQLRLIRQITCENNNRSYEGITGEAAKTIDIEICNKIYDIITKEEQKADLSITKKFVGWLNWMSRDFPKEIFTSNYDLLLEKAFESLKIPYYDGFVGSNEPFFLPQSLEKELRDNYPPLAWIRLWKIHGSLSWFWKQNEDNKSHRIVRLGVHAKKFDINNELVIYPSREKYESSRKQPFIAYFDRLKKFLLDGEGLFIINGYSFSDEHINNIIFDCLRQNIRLHVLGFFFSDMPIEYIHDSGNVFMNFSAYSAHKAIIKGILAEWEIKKSDSFLKEFYDTEDNKLILGDFKKMVDFLLLCSGMKEKIEKEVELQ